MNAYKNATVVTLVDKGCEMMGWHAWALGLDAQLCAALYYLNDIIEQVGEHTATGRMWMKWERYIENMRNYYL